jgi:hypothetical protein
MPDATPRGWLSSRQQARLSRRASLIWIAYACGYAPMGLPRAAELIAKQHRHFITFVWPRWCAVQRPVPANPATVEDCFAVMCAEEMRMPGPRQIIRILRKMGVENPVEMSPESQAASGHGDRSVKIAECPIESDATARRMARPRRAGGRVAHGQDRGPATARTA